MNKIKKMLTASLVISSLFGFAKTPDGWTTNYEAALKQAEKENKKILANFTGSDWCGWCKLLEAEVFGTELFKKEAPKSYVLLYVDLPHDRTGMSDEQFKKNKQLGKKYSIAGYPTILLLDGKGKALGKTGYQKGGPAPYLKNLQKVIAKAEYFQNTFAKAKTLTGLEKAKKLDEAISSIEGREQYKYKEEMNTIIKLDPENKAGLKSKYTLINVIRPEFQKMKNEIYIKHSDLAKTMRHHRPNPQSKEYKDALEAYNNAVAKSSAPIIEMLKNYDKKFAFKGNDRQEYLDLLASALLMMNKFEESVQTLNDGIEINPNSTLAKRLKKRANVITEYHIKGNK